LVGICFSTPKFTNVKSQEKIVSASRLQRTRSDVQAFKAGQAVKIDSLRFSPGIFTEGNEENKGASPTLQLLSYLRLLANAFGVFFCQTCCPENVAQ
jgi:hypothetical protein